MKIKKALPLILSITLLATTISGCSNNSNNQEKDGDSAKAKDSNSTDVATPKGQFPIASQDVTLNFYAASDYADFNQKTYKENVSLKRITDEMGVNLDFTFLPNSGEAKTKVTLAFASGSYVDGAMLSPQNSFNRSDIVKYGTSEGYLVPLNNYIDKYSTNLASILDKRPGYKPMLTAPDGKIYGIPDFKELTQSQACPKAFINKQWLKNLGLKTPTTTEELHDVLVAFRDNDPNQNGIKDEIPMTGSISNSCALEYWLMNSFLDCPATTNQASPRTFLTMNDKGEIEFAANKDAYLQGLTYMNKLYNEDLIDPANFTQKQDALKQEANQNPNANVIGIFTADSMSIAITNTTKLGSEYEVLVPLKGPDGVQYQPYNPFDTQIKGFAFSVFDTCEHPDVAFRVADYLLQPTPSAILKGTEGVIYTKNTDTSIKDYNGNTQQYIIKKLDSKATQEQKDTYNLNYINFIHPLGAISEVANLSIPELTPENIAKTQESFNTYTTELVAPYFPKVSLPRDIFMVNQEATTKFNELLLSINQCVQTNTAKFITGARPLSEWSNYLKELDGYGLDEYVKLYSDSYKVMQNNK